MSVNTAVRRYLRAAASTNRHGTARRRGVVVRHLKELLYRNIGSPRQRYRDNALAYMYEGTRVLDIGCGYTAVFDAFHGN